MPTEEYEVLPSFFVFQYFRLTNCNACMEETSLRPSLNSRNVWFSKWFWNAKVSSFFDPNHHAIRGSLSLRRNLLHLLVHISTKKRKNPTQVCRVCTSRREKQIEYGDYETITFHLVHKTKPPIMFATSVQSFIYMPPILLKKWHFKRETIAFTASSQIFKTDGCYFLAKWQKG